jgi:hypothetical protein
MNPELSMVRSLRKVLESAGEGRGLARSAVDELRRASPAGLETSRMLLLGIPLRSSLGPIAEGGFHEASMLASLIIAAPRSSASMVGRSGEELAGTLERWIRARENRRLEQKVLRFRSLVTSGVLGAVTAMVASLGPLLGSLNFDGTAQGPDPVTLLAGAAAMAAIASALLGLFMSGRGFLLNVAVTLLVFVAVGALATPLTSVPSVAAWGVK